ncbi:MAG TPA: TIGR03013 family XrtA/PEP-CTERM system glycosyltransferase [Caulobacteraceae bacterium]|jgi:sugar transferase (PEP-CTERM system associated)
MKLLGHYVERDAVAYAGLDGILFFLPLAWISFPHAFATPGIGLEPYQAVAIALGLLLLTISLGVYNNDAAHNVGTYLKRFLVSWEFIALAVLLFVVISSVVARGQLGLSPLILGTAAAAVMLVQMGLRLILGWWLGQSTHKRRVLILGDAADAEKVRDFLRGPGRDRFEHLTTLERWGPDLEPTRMGNVLLTGAPAAALSLSELAQTLKSDEIVVACEDHGALPVDELLECKLRGIQVVDAHDFWEREAGVVEVARGAGAWLALSEGLILRPAARRAKRVIDIAISLAFLLFVSPLCLLAALAIALDSPGPVFYGQERVGLNGVTFRAWKFRSMRVDAESDGAPRWATSSDDRVTRVGRFIRKVRIDEIPQVLNVLAGEMSFIGPRPERPFFVEQLRKQIPYYDLRHRVRPGITGWAQVNYPYGASVEDARRKLAYDLYYLKRCNLVLDLIILLQTVRVVLFAHGGR